MVRQISTLLIAVLNRITIGYKMRNPGSSQGKNLQINGRIKIHGDGAFVIGNNVRINSSESSNPIGGMEHTILVANAPGRLEIGNNVGISNSAIVCRNSIVIEENVKLGGNVKIYDTDFHALNSAVRSSDADRDAARSAPILIKKNAFIGAHSIILKGVTIGEGAIIGAGSVVTKNVGDYEIWAGNPAKLVREQKVGI